VVGGVSNLVFSLFFPDGGFDQWKACSLNFFGSCPPSVYVKPFFPASR